MACDEASLSCDGLMTDAPCRLYTFVQCPTVPSSRLSLPKALSQSSLGVRSSSRTSDPIGSDGGEIKVVVSRALLRPNAQA